MAKKLASASKRATKQAAVELALSPTPVAQDCSPNASISLSSALPVRVSPGKLEWVCRDSNTLKAGSKLEVLTVPALGAPGSQGCATYIQPVWAEAADATFKFDIVIEHSLYHTNGGNIKGAPISVYRDVLMQNNTAKNILLPYDFDILTRIEDNFVPVYPGETMWIVLGQASTGVTLAVHFYIRR